MLLPHALSCSRIVIVVGQVVGLLPGFSARRTIYMFQTWLKGSPLFLQAFGLNSSF